MEDQPIVSQLAGGNVSPTTKDGSRKPCERHYKSKHIQIHTYVHTYMDAYLYTHK